jgi:hypothetical protein
MNYKKVSLAWHQVHTWEFYDRASEIQWQSACSNSEQVGNYDGSYGMLFQSQSYEPSLIRLQRFVFFVTLRTKQNALGE